MLARFRANPSKVRIGIRREETWWVATVSSRDPRGPVYQATATGPRKALVKALLSADADGLDGVDLSMGWAYDHPQHLHS